MYLFLLLIAPHTPLASSKRARGIVKDAKIQSPLKQPADRTGKKVVIPPTTGALFSPALHLDQSDDSPSGGENDSDNTTPSHGPEEENEECYNNGEDDFNPYQFISGLPPHSSVFIRGKVCLPQKSPATPSMTLTLDLDETLVHCSVEPIPNPDIVFPVNFNGTEYQVFVRKRPFLDRFLETVSKHFEVIVFTASQRVYADKLLGITYTRILYSFDLFLQLSFIPRFNRS